MSADARRYQDAGAAAVEAVRASDRAFAEAIENWTPEGLREWARRLQDLADAALYLAEAMERAKQ